MDILKEILEGENLLHTFGYLLAVLLLFLLSKLVYKLIHYKKQTAILLFEQDNVAYAFSYVGYFVGILIISGGVLLGDTAGFWVDLLHIGVYGLLGMLFLHLAVYLSNRLILPKFDLKKEILIDRNLGTGIIEFAVYMATALLLFGALVGESQSLEEGLITFVGYWVLGMIGLVLATKLYSKWLDYDLHHEIERDNIAAGVSFAGVLVAVGIVLMHALSFPFHSWEETMWIYLYYLIAVLIGLPIIRYITDWFLVPGKKLTDEIVHQEHPNIGASLIEVFSYIAAAVWISWIW
ncbi:MAG: DUF350 domain-containing protein [Flavobacteriaceae bacterium]|nr:DUF350 domain-containing protein [Flavobacteriaceae bacterium]